jgi:hypothetical protein
VRAAFEPRANTHFFSPSHGFGILNLSCKFDKPSKLFSALFLSQNSVLSLCLSCFTFFFFRQKALPSLGRAQNQKICHQFDAAFLRSATGCSDLRNAYQFDFCVMTSLTLCVAQLLLYLDSRMIAELDGGLCVACLIRQFDKQLTKDIIFFDIGISELLAKYT